MYQIDALARFRRLFLFSGAAALLFRGPSSAQSQAPNRAADELLAADRAYSTAAVGSNVVDGLSRMFAADVIMPTPNGGFARGAAAVKEALAKNPDNARSKLEWTPVRVGVSADGR